MDQVVLKAYGKINLTLDIVGRRPDGYHLLSSVMQSVSVADTITVIKKPRGISIKTDHPQVPTDEGNICWRAVTAFQNATGLTGGVQIELIKRIPVAAGLGGGSADAAAILHGLNKLYGADLDLAQLQAIGLSVGADVPFCLQGGTCLVEGIGERVESLKAFPQATFVLVKPDASVSTAEVYKNLQPQYYGGKSTQELIRLLAESKDACELAPVFANALESVTMTLVPDVQVWKARLVDHGAHGALMSGSGPTVFGLFSNSEKATSFQELYANQAQVHVVEPNNVGVWEMNGGDR